MKPLLPPRPTTRSISNSIKLQDDCVIVDLVTPLQPKHLIKACSSTPTTPSSSTTTKPNRSSSSGHRILRSSPAEEKVDLYALCHRIKARTPSRKLSLKEDDNLSVASTDAVVPQDEQTVELNNTNTASKSSVPKSFWSLEEYREGAQSDEEEDEEDERFAANNTVGDTDERNGSQNSAALFGESQLLNAFSPSQASFSRLNVAPSYVVNTTPINLAMPQSVLEEDTSSDKENSDEQATTSPSADNSPPTGNTTPVTTPFVHLLAAGTQQGVATVETPFDVAELFDTPFDFDGSSNTQDALTKEKTFVATPFLAKKTTRFVAPSDDEESVDSSKSDPQAEAQLDDDKSGEETPSNTNSGKLALSPRSEVSYASKLNNVTHSTQNEKIEADADPTDVLQNLLYDSYAKAHPFDKANKKRVINIIDNPKRAKALVAMILRNEDDIELTELASRFDYFSF